MTPELQRLIDQADAAQRKAEFLGYSTYLAIIICGVFSVLIFWKLCQIQKQLMANVQAQLSMSSSPARSSISSAPVVANNPKLPVQDDSRYRPKL
jgi:hypothetical protein